MCPLEAESIKPGHALFHQLPRAILLTELIEAAVFASVHVNVTVCLLVLLEVVNPLVERPRDVCFRRPNKAESIKGRYVLVSQFYPFARIFMCMPRPFAECGKGFVIGNRHVGVDMRLLEPLQVLH